MSDEMIKLKGAGDGVRIYLSNDESMSVLIKALHSKLDSFRKFFGSGHCNIYFMGREFTKSDRLRLESIAKTMLPEGNVSFGERKHFSEPVLTVMEEAKKDYGINDREELESIKRTVKDGFRRNHARFFEGVVGNGQTVESDGHLTLVGEVEKGGTLVAMGNIVVAGGIYGTVKAGCMGNDEAYIIANKLSPEHIDIAGRTKVMQGNINNEYIQKAYLINNEIFIENFCEK